MENLQLDFMTHKGALGFHMLPGSTFTSRQNLETIIWQSALEKEAIHWDDPEGWYGEGGGMGVQDWEHLWQIHVDVWQNQYNIVK